MQRSVISSSAVVIYLACTSYAAPPRVGWHDERTLGAFVFHANYSLRMRQPLLQEIVTMPAVLNDALGLTIPDGTTIDVYVFSRRSTYDEYMHRHFPQIPKRRAMFIKTRSPGNVFAYEHRDLAIDLRHECIHAALHSALPFVPLWLDEGLAEYFEVPAGKRAYDNPHFKSIRRSLTWKRPMSLEELEDIENLEDMGHREYRDSWAWVHFMLHGPPVAKRVLRQYLSEIASHTVPVPIGNRLSAAVPDLHRQFKVHFQNWHQR